MPVQQLSIEHEVQIKVMRLRAESNVGQPTTFTINPNHALMDIRYKSLYLNPANSTYRCYGEVGTDKKLRSVVSVKLFPDKHTWYLQWICVLDNHTDLLFQTLAIVMHQLEAEGYYCWVGCIPSKFEEVYNKMWRNKCKLPDGTNVYAPYSSVVLEHLNSYQQPTKTEHWQDLFMHAVQSIPMSIREHTNTELQNKLIVN